MLSLSGVSAWVEVDGKELEQYCVEEDLARNQVICWIATQAGKGFSVVFRDDAAYREHSLASFIQLDGTRIPGKVLEPIRPETARNNRTVIQNDQPSSVTSSRPFIFSKLELTDEDEYLNQSSNHLGEIQITIHRVQPVEVVLFEPRTIISGHGKVHERSKKAVTHCISYGQEVKTATQYSCRVRYLDDNAPLATFVFKYRDSSLLQANGIIPRPPPAKKAAVTFEEVRDLSKDVKEEPGIEIVEDTNRRRTSFPSKRANSGRDNEAQPAKRIKREKKFVPTGEVIDLT